MSRQFLFVALIVMLVCAFAFAASRTHKVESCHDDIDGKTQKTLCLNSWQDVAGDNDSTNPKNFCQWCNAQAVPPICADSTQVARVPPSVFQCTNDTIAIDLF